MIQVKNVKFKSYEFTGTVELSQLSEEQLKTLKINPDTFESDEVEVSGDFSVSFDDSDPCVEVNNATIFADEKGEVSLELTDDICDFDDLANKIQEQDDGNWYQEHLESLGDRAYDDYKDRQMED